MDSKDTGKVTLSIEENNYLHAVIYTNDEIVEDDIEPVTDYLKLFNDPLPALIERKGHYSISLPVQIAMLQQTKHFLKAVAFIERNHKDVIMTKIAANTYFKDVAVKSFYEKNEAVTWLSQYFLSQPLQPKAQHMG